MPNWLAKAAKLSLLSFCLDPPVILQLMVGQLNLAIIDPNISANGLANDVPNISAIGTYGQRYLLLVCPTRGARGYP
jgi:hypothetical protein